jgi:hypothetical protein
MDSLPVIDLRSICNRPEDYANPIEPSSIGGEKIARAIVALVTDATPTARGARIVGSLGPDAENEGRIQVADDIRGQPDVQDSFGRYEVGRTHV